jgi:hypothetical protein
VSDEGRAPGRSGPNRRELLKAGVIAGAVVGTGGWRYAARAPQDALRQPGSLPYPDLPAGTDTIPQIEHIVVMMMENHSYDNYLGMLRRPGADGFRLGRGGLPTATNPYANGNIQHAFHMPTTCQLTGMPSQSWLDRRPHQHLRAGGGQVEPARDDVAGRERPQPAGHAGPALPGVPDPADPGPAAGGHRPERPGLQRQRTGHHPAPGFGHPAATPRRRLRRIKILSCFPRCCPDRHATVC